MVYQVSQIAPPDKIEFLDKFPYVYKSDPATILRKSTERAPQWRRNELKVRGHRSGAKVGGPPLFGSKSTISRFGERCRDGKYSLVSFLFSFLLLTVPFQCPAIGKSGGHVPPPWSRRHCSCTNNGKIMQKAANIV